MQELLTRATWSKQKRKAGKKGGWRLRCLLGPPSAPSLAAPANSQKPGRRGKRRRRSRVAAPRSPRRTLPGPAELSPASRAPDPGGVGAEGGRALGHRQGAGGGPCPAGPGAGAARSQPGAAERDARRRPPAQVKGRARPGGSSGRAAGGPAALEFAVPAQTALWPCARAGASASVRVSVSVSARARLVGEWVCARARRPAGGAAVLAFLTTRRTEPCQGSCRRRRGRGPCCALDGQCSAGPARVTRRWPRSTWVGRGSGE